jgi:light-regulated signal transduction histidine kinase (bacteriophytochrome)
VVDAAQRRLAAELEANEVALVRSSLPVVRADAAQLEEVFTCLIDNAVKFRKPDRDPRVDVSAEDGDGEWRFAVRDNGIGIDPRHWGRIFIVFQRLHTQREYPGLGLGLALCRAIVERHGGRIWVESEPGSGSTFRFTVSRDAIGG